MPHCPYTCMYFKVQILLRGVGQLPNVVKVIRRGSGAYN